jgi:hypothetical protein
MSAVYTRNPAHPQSSLDFIKWFCGLCVFQILLTQIMHPKIHFIKCSGPIISNRPSKSLHKIRRSNQIRRFPRENGGLKKSSWFCPKIQRTNLVQWCISWYIPYNIPYNIPPYKRFCSTLTRWYIPWYQAGPADFLPKSGGFCEFTDMLTQEIRRILMVRRILWSDFEIHRIWNDFYSTFPEYWCLDSM